MTVEFRGEDPEGEVAKNSLGARSYSRVFKLQSDSKATRAYEVGSNANLPKIGSVHPSDSNAFCRDLEVRPAPGTGTNALGWIVTASYSDERVLAEDPTSDPALISWDSEQYQRPAVFDSAGNSVCNSAGDPFDPPCMMDDSRRVVTIVKNLAVVPSWILTYQDAINSDVFSVDGISVAVGLAKCQRVSVGPPERRNGTAFRAVTLQIHLEKNGWWLEPLDAGFRRNVSGVLENITNPEPPAGDGLQPTAAVPLNGSGDALSNPSFTNNVFLNFAVYSSLPFSSLPLT